MADWQWPPYKRGQTRARREVDDPVSPVRKFRPSVFNRLIKLPVFSDSRVDGITTVLFSDSNRETSEKEAKAFETVLVKGLGANPSKDDPERWAKVR
jgi:hypothetical protein